MDRVSQTIFISKDVLCPIVAIGSSIYLSLIKFSLYHKNAIFRNYHMVYLDRVPILTNEQIVDDFVFLLWEF